MPPEKPYEGKVFRTVIDAYLDKGKFKTLAPSTQRNYLRILKIADENIGDVPCDHMRTSVVQEFIDGFDDLPATKHYVLSVMQAIQKFALARSLLPLPICIGCEAPVTDGARPPWTDEQVAYAELKLPRWLGRAVTLAANTGQRGSDLIRMRWSDMKQHGGYWWIDVRQQKTGLEIWVPFTHGLTTAMHGWEREPGYILRKQDGQPYDNRQQLTDAWSRKRARHPELRQLIWHALRGTAVMRLQARGCTAEEISSMVGMSPKMVVRYTKKAEQREKALTALRRMDGPSNVVPLKRTGDER